MARAFSKRVPPCCGVAIGDSGGTRGADTIAARRAGSDPAQRRRRRDGFHPRRGTRQRWGLYRGHNGAELLPGVLGNGGSDLAVMAFRSSTWCPALRHHDSMKYSQKLLVSVLVATLFGALLTVTLSTPVAAGTDVHDGMAPEDGSIRAKGLLQSHRHEMDIGPWSRMYCPTPPRHELAREHRSAGPISTISSVRVTLATVHMTPNR